MIATTSCTDADGPHALLEPTTPAYTNATVRRAFIVWMHCGQRNSFKDVCNYYHQLESLEDKLPADQRAASRNYEFNMFSNPPPTSPYLEHVFPKLYTQSNTIQHYITKVDSIRSNHFNVEKQQKLEDINLETFDMQALKGVTTNEILETSQMIKKYCKTYMKPVRKFLAEFKEYARKCELNYTVNNVTFYIKRKMVEEELQMVSNYSRTLSFLNLSNNDEKKDFLALKSEKEKKDFLALKSEKEKTDFLALKSEKEKKDFLAMKSEKEKKEFLDVNFDKKYKKEEKVKENQTKILLKQVAILTRDKKAFLDQYWDDLTYNFGKINTRNLLGLEAKK